MAVVQADIKADLLQLYNDAKAAPMTEDTFADRMATIIADAIQTGEGVPKTSGPDQMKDSLGAQVTGKTEIN